jgi:phosphoribosyl 1,2-cyclic phosphodiesterase
MFSFASIASGSNGNCYYIGNDEDSILIDVGISCRMLEKRMRALNLDIGLVKAVFVTHEHSDHICGLDTFVKKYQIPIYINEATLQNSRLKIPEERLNAIKTGEKISAGGFSLLPFSKPHDAADPLNFLISREGYHLGVFTDMGHASEELKKYLRYCHAVFLESNYCEQMLEASSYPAVLRKRISGRNGHLSNSQAFELLSEAAGPQLRHIILSHLSANNNTPDKVAAMFKSLMERYKIHIASRSEPSPLFQLDKTAEPVRLPAPRPDQLKLPW